VLWVLHDMNNLLEILAGVAGFVLLWLFFFFLFLL
jgi:hypothetical protein